MEDKLVCPVCGEPTYLVYGKNPRKDRLCGKHAKDLFDGKLLLCEKCNQWRYADKPCKCEQTTATTISENKPILGCLICGAETNGQHFCIDCYKKYSNKVLYLKVLKCKEFEKLDAEYESDFVCDDGHLVKSPYEKIIDNWLYQEGIQHAYEVKIDIDKDKDLTPDFYIPEYNGTKDIYIEFWGYDASNIKYQQRKEYKLEVYPKLVKRDGITVVYLNKKEVENNTYKKKIKYAEQGKINE